MPNGEREREVVDTLAYIDRKLLPGAALEVIFSQPSAEINCGYGLFWPSEVGRPLNPVAFAGYQADQVMALIGCLRNLPPSGLAINARKLLLEFTQRQGRTFFSISGQLRGMAKRATPVADGDVMFITFAAVDVDHLKRHKGHIGTEMDDSSSQTYVRDYLIDSKPLTINIEDSNDGWVWREARIYGALRCLYPTLLIQTLTRLMEPRSDKVAVVDMLAVLRPAEPYPSFGAQDNLVHKPRLDQFKPLGENLGLRDVLAEERFITSREKFCKLERSPEYYAKEDPTKEGINVWRKYSYLHLKDTFGPDGNKVFHMSFEVIPVAVWVQDE